VPGEPWLGHAIVLVVALQRAIEALFSRRNLRRLLARGGVRPMRDVTATLVGVHVAWFASMLAERDLLGARMPGPAAAVPLVVGVLCIEALRAWVLSTLRSRWTIQVVVVPGEAPVRRGPYRFLRHPNYVVVLSEVLLVSLLVGAVRSAAVFVPLTAIALALRIRREEAAWREHGGAPLGSS
jgi:methyltransferase